MTESERLFKIKSHERLNANRVEETESLLDHGDIMVGTFRVSRNYFRLKPGEPYIYDKNIPYTHPKSGLPASHAAMVIGMGSSRCCWKKGRALDLPALATSTSKTVKVSDSEFWESCKSFIARAVQDHSTATWIRSL
ncbi:hypothetical protein PR202_gb26027 [Eleusine coracana subsp. coracana]|uniref:Uncharacterized protein n=1 Tax=Eleusine coracana subsp. coracana TaxID=191504 RepID=A0AAV5FQT4_ELECO|nr:hypothetical protein PR202_gb26027 [Eleusine coracana subsp. coracana]